MVKEVANSKENESSLLGRFFHLLSAFSVEAVLGPIFYLGLAWHNAALYGDVMYAVMASAVVTISVQFGLYAPLVRELSDPERDKREVLLRYSYLRIGIMTITVICTAIAVQWLGLSKHLAWMTIIIAIGRGCKELAFTFFADLRVRGQQKLEGRIVMVSVFSAFTYAFAALALGLSPEALSAYMFIWGLVLTTLAFKQIKKTYGSLFEAPVQTNLLKPTLAAGVIFALVALLRLAYHHTTVLFLERASGSKAVGYYCASLGIVDVTILIVSGLYLEAVFFPEINKLWDKDREKTTLAFRKNASWLLAITIPIAYFIFVKSETIIRLVYPPNYTSSIYVLKCMALTIPTLCLASVFYNFLIVSKQEKTLLFLGTTAFLVNFGLNWTLVRTHGIYGAALVPVFTALFLVLQYLVICQLRHRLFAFTDLLVPLLSISAIMGLHKLLSLVLPIHVDIIVGLILYGLTLLIYRLRYVGRPAAQMAV